MITEKYILHWRTAPRSVSVLLSWLPYFYRYQDENYNQTAVNLYPNTSPSNKVVRPTRRKIAYAYEKEVKDTPDNFVNASIEEFSRGYQPGNKKKDRADKESRVRQVVATAAQLGLMYPKDAKLTEMGEKVVRKTFDSDDLVRQLLKMYVVLNKDDAGVFPFKTYIEIINKFGYISRNEMTFIFGVLNNEDINQALDAVSEFRSAYNKLPNKNIDADVKRILRQTWDRHFHPIDDKKLFNTIRKDYTDAFGRFLIYTNLFYSHGRGTATKFRPLEINAKKVEMLISKMPFKKPPKTKDDKIPSSEDSAEWFGSTNNLILPWENKEELATIVATKIDMARKELKNLKNKALSFKKLDEWQHNIDSMSYDVLKEVENKIDNAIKIKNEEEYVQITSQTKENRQEILNRYELIQNNADESALWLEVNTWKAFVSLEGQDKKVVPNFNMNPDLTPRSFAPGVGDTPDMEVYFDKSAIIPEVSLMTGVQQWEHEGSSVIDHVLKKIKEHEDRKVLGLFISSSINIRTNWQFFLLNRESWVGAPVPVVPLRLDTFVDILKFMYKHHLGIENFNDLIWKISKLTFKLNNYSNWANGSDEIISDWKKNKGIVTEC